MLRRVILSGLWVGLLVVGCSYLPQHRRPGTTVVEMGESGEQETEDEETYEEQTKRRIKEHQKNIERVFPMEPSRKY